MLGVWVASGASSATVFVAPGGRDEWEGTKGTPLATLDGARERVRQIRLRDPQAPVTVEFAAGQYPLRRPVVFTPEDSGVEASPVTYAAARGAAPSFSCGLELPRFEAGPDGVWRAKVAPGFRFEQLYVNGRRATRARSPNQFYFYMQAPAPYGFDPLTGKPADLTHRAFYAAPADVAPLAGMSLEALSNVIVTVYHSWEVSHARVQAVEPGTGRVVATGSSPWPFFRWGTYLPRYHLENFKAALDAPGEWFLDQDGTLLYLPLPGETPSKTVAVAPATDAFLRFEGDALLGRWVSDLVFSGLTFEHAGYELPARGQGDGQAAVSQPAAVELDGVRRVAFRDCTFAHLGAHGVWFRKGCRDSVIERCRIYDVGAGAVRVGDSKWSEAELPDKLTAFITVDNNILQEGGRFFRGATGVWIGHASDVRVTHNDIGDFYYTGISMGWTWGYAKTVTHRNTLSYNHIHHLGWGVLSDMGGIYTLGRSDDTVLAGNHIHDVYSYDYTGRGGWGLYTDEGSAGLIFERNLVHHTKTGNVHQHYGQENVFRNNILACSMDGQIQRSRIESHRTVILTNNVIYWDNGSAAFWRGHAGAYGTVTDVVVNANMYWNPGGIATNAFNGVSWEAWRALGQDVDSRIADPRFKDPASGDFRFRWGSPVAKAGFQPFDYESAGVYGSRAWRKLAAEKAYPAVQFAPTPARFVVRRLREDFDALPLRAPFPNVDTHVEKKGDGVLVTDEQACSGKQSLKVQDAADLAYFYNPHFTFSCAFTNATVENTFAVRMPSDAEFFTEWRDYPEGGGNGYATGPCLVFRGGKIYARTRVAKADGSLTAGERAVAEVPPDTWARVTVRAGVGASGTSRWSVRVERAGAPPVELASLPFASDAFRAVEWLGFCSTAKTQVAFYLDDFAFGEKE